MNIPASDNCQLLFVDTPGPNEAFERKQVGLYDKLASFVRQCQRIMLIVNIAELNSQAFEETLELVIRAFQTRGDKKQSLVIILNQSDNYSVEQDGSIDEFIDRNRRSLEKKFNFQIDTEYVLPISAKDALLARLAFAEVRKANPDRKKLKEFVNKYYPTEPEERIIANYQKIANGATNIFKRSKFDSIYRVIIDRFIPDIYLDLCNSCKADSLQILQKINSDELPRVKSKLNKDKQIFDVFVSNIKKIGSQLENQLRKASDSKIKQAKRDIDSVIERLRSLFAGPHKFPNISECRNTLNRLVDVEITSINQVLTTLNQNLTDQANDLVKQLQRSYSDEIKREYIKEINSNVLIDCLVMRFDGRSVYLDSNSLIYNFSFESNEYIIENKRFGNRTSPALAGEICHQHPYYDEIFCKWFEVEIDSLLNKLKQSIDSHFRHFSVENYYNFNHITNLLGQKNQECNTIVDRYNNLFSQIERDCNQHTEFINQNFLRKGETVDTNISKKLPGFSGDFIIRLLERIKDDLEVFGNPHKDDLKVFEINEAISHLTAGFKALNDGKLKIAVIGTGKSGKSTFINALIGDQIALSRITSATLFPQLFKVEEQILNLEATNVKIDCKISPSFKNIFREIYNFLLEIDPTELQKINFIRTQDTEKTLKNIKDKTPFDKILPSDECERREWISWISMCNDLLRILLHSGTTGAKPLADKALNMGIEDYPLVSLSRSSEI